MANGFVAHAILLACERKGRERGGLKIGEGTGKGVERASADPKLQIPQPEQRIEGVVGNTEVLARAQQEVKTDHKACGHRPGEGARVCIRRCVLFSFFQCLLLNIKLCPISRSLHADG